jgi:hypothetical protein
LVEIFVGVDVRLLLRLCGFAGFFGAGGFGDGWGIRLRFLRAGGLGEQRSGRGCAQQDGEAECAAGGPSRVGRAGYQFSRKRAGGRQSGGNLEFWGDCTLSAWRSGNRIVRKRHSQEVLERWDSCSDGGGVGGGECRSSEVEEFKSSRVSDALLLTGSGGVAEYSAVEFVF